MYRDHQQPNAPITMRATPFAQPIYLNTFGKVSTPDPIAALVIPRILPRKLPFSILEK